MLLTLPPISPLKATIIGDEYDAIDIAKRSAAVKACIELYKIGELDENLLPKKVEDSMVEAQHLFPYMEDEEKSPEAMPGTTSKKRLHQRIVSFVFIHFRRPSGLRVRMHVFYVLCIFYSSAVKNYCITRYE